MHNPLESLKDLKPDPPPGEGAAAQSRLAAFRERASTRRWLVFTAALILFTLSFTSGLPPGLAIAGSVIMLAVALLLPGEQPETGLALPDHLAERPEEEDYTGEAERLIAGIPEPVLLLSASAFILAYNRYAEDNFPGLAAGRHLTSIIRSPQVLKAATLAAKGDGPRTVNYIERVPVERRIAATLSPLYPERENAPAIMIFLRDLTGQARLDEMRTDFVANASHELKTPLASLTGFIETLQGPAKNDEQVRERFLAIMLKQTRRMSRLVENLLSLSRVEMHTHLRPEGKVDLAEVVRHAMQALEPQARGANVTLEFGGPAGETLVQGDRDELSQVLHNLIHNAIKYGNKGGHVRISVEYVAAPKASECKAVLRVADDGPGIGPQHLPRLTERFYRGPGSASNDQSSAGLGLAIVQQVITRHRGELQVDSELGKGSTFSVTLPAMPRG
jgi:two-component system phosphate regulon sensor histidine kinase PhoR